MLRFKKMPIWIRGTSLTVPMPTLTLTLDSVFLQISA
ncbi:hypothetical protein EVA_06788 [gut metagenome]|uniref:Uncharacterized protein n=1 Tax=gut metagenome TaxID=749906 RepID=J9GRF4_9ZZZZ